MWKFSPPLEFDRRHVQPVAIRYTHYATSTTSNILEGTVLGSNTDFEQFHPLAISFARICDKPSVEKHFVWTELDQVGWREIQA